MAFRDNPDQVPILVHFGAWLDGWTGQGGLGWMAGSILWFLMVSSWFFTIAHAQIQAWRLKMAQIQPCRLKMAQIQAWRLKIAQIQPCRLKMAKIQAWRLKIAEI